MGMASDGNYNDYENISCQQREIFLAGKPRGFESKMRKVNIEVGDRVAAECGCFGIVMAIHTGCLVQGSRITLYHVNWLSKESPGSLKTRPLPLADESGNRQKGVWKVGFEKRQGYQRGELQLLDPAGVGWNAAQGSERGL
jgi:hypothetical protein